MGKKKSADINQVLMACGIGMVGLFAGLMLFGIIQSHLAPEVEIGKPAVIQVTKSGKSDFYEIEFSVKNNEKKSVKADLVIKLGFDVYRMRHSTSPKPNFYRFFQVLSESTDEVVLPARSEQKILTKVDVKADAYQKFEIKPDTKIYPRVNAEKLAWAEESEKV